MGKRSGKRRSVASRKVYQAIKALQNRTGSSAPEILKYLKSQSGSRKITPLQVKVALARGVKTRHLVRNGAAFKLRAASKKRRRSTRRSRSRSKSRSRSRSRNARRKRRSVKKATKKASRTRRRNTKRTTRRPLSSKRKPAAARKARRRRRRSSRK